LLLEHSTDAIFHTVDGVIEWVSPAVERLLGLHPVTLRGTTAAALCHPDDGDLLDRPTDLAEPRRGRVRHRDGSWCRVECSVRRHDDSSSGDAVSYVAVVRDVSREEDSSIAAEYAERRLGTLLDSISEAVVIIGPDGKHCFGNRVTQRLLGYSSDELANLPARDWIHPDDFEMVLEQLGNVRQDHAPSPMFQTRLINRSGAVVTVGVTITDFTDDPVIGGLVATFRDLTDELEAKALLEASQDRHQELMRVIPDAVVVIEDGVFTFGNDAAVALSGIGAEEEFVGMPVTMFQTPDVIAETTAFARRFQKTGVTDGPLVAWMHRIDGTPVQLEATAAQVPGNDRALLLVLRDVTERAQLIAELAESEATGRFLTENSTDVLLRVNDDHRVVFASTALYTILGHRPGDLVGVDIHDVIEAEDRWAFEAALEHACAVGAAAPVEVRAKRAPDGGYVWVQATVGTVVVANGDDPVVEYHITLCDVSRQRDDRLALAASELRMRTLVGAAPIGIFELTPEGRCTFVNERYCEILGADGIDDVQGLRWTRLIHPDDLGDVLAFWQTALAQPKQFDLTTRFIRPDGAIVYAQIGAVPVLDGDIAVSWLGTIDDITERVALEHARREASDLFVAAFDNAPTGLMLLTADAVAPRLLQANSAVMQMTGRTLEQLSSLDFVGVTHPDDAGVDAAGWSALVAGEIEMHQMEIRRCYRGAAWRWYSLTRSLVRDSDGLPLYVIAQSTDVTERKETENRTYQLAVTDPLTGLPNRRHFQDRLDHTHARLSRSTALIGVIFIDLDHFKAVNDELGHGTGDELLQRIGQLLSGAVRPGDTVARLGGDEFAVLAEHDHEDELLEMAERLRSVLDITVPLPDGSTHRVTASIGVASRMAREAVPSQLVQLADQAMYDAKRQGRHQWSVAELV
jgi:diguanylate cyclase (GGDEF)-like protein/PAS domain S-box-containing protein